MVATLGAVAAVGITYFVAARLGLALLLARSDIAVFWPASGVAAGILIVTGRRAVPAVLMGVVVGTIAAGLTSDSRNLLTSLLNGTWNAGETLLAAWLLERWFGQPFTFGDLRHVGGFLVASGLATALSGVGGAGTMILLHPETIAPCGDVWREWFLSSWVGLVVVGPLVIGAAQIWRKPVPRKEWIEGVGLLSLTAVACSYTMTRATGSWVSFSPGAFVLPLLLWLTARCQPTFAIAGAFFASVAIICATTFGIGRFGDAAVPVAHRVAGAQLAMMTVTLFTLVLAVLFAQRRESEAQLAKKSAALARLHGISSRLWRTRDLHRALGEILEGAIELLRADKGNIQLLDTARGELTIAVNGGFQQEFLDRFHVVSAADESACGRALRSGERVVIEDVEVDALFAPFRPAARLAGYRAVQSTPIAGREGKPLGMLSTHFCSVHQPNREDLVLLDIYVRQAADIIERHAGEDALRESEARLRLAQLKTGISVWDRNLRTGKITMTPELETLWGLEPGTMKWYLDFRAQVHPDDIAAYEEARDAAVRCRTTFEVEYRIIRRDEQVRWMVTRGGAIYDEVTGEPIRLVGNDADITERKLAELALAERNAQLLLAGKDAGVGCYANNIKTGLIAVTEGYAAIHGLPEGTTQTTLSRWRTKVHSDDVAQFDERCRQIFDRRRRDYMFDYRIIRDGGTRWIESRGVVSYDKDEQPEQCIGINIDITERKEAEIALAERNAQLALAGTAALVGSFSYDINSGLMQVSEGYVAIHGLRQGVTETTRREWRDRVHLEDVGRLDGLRNQALAEQRREYYSEYRIVLPDRGVRWIESRSFISYDVNGNARRVIGVNIDVTARKTAEQALAERNAQLTLAGNVAGVGYFAYDVATRHLVAISDGYAAIYGWPEGTTRMAVDYWRTRVHPDDLAQFDQTRRRVFANRSHDHSCDFRILRADGQIRWIDSRRFISYDREGNPLRIIGVNIDVTKRKQTEALLKESKARLSDALTAGQVVAFEWDAATGRSQRSDNAERILGVVQGGGFLRQVHPADRRNFIALIRNLSPGNPSYTLTFRFDRADGRDVWLEEEAKGEFDTSGKLLCIKGLTRDITERKELEDHKSTLISELDHRVKNVLAIVSTVASRTQETSGSMAEFVTAFDGRIKSLAITHELLSSRHWQGVPLGEVVRRELAPYATARNTRLNGPDVVLSAEAGQLLAMVFHELVTNAAKFGALSVKFGRVSVLWNVTRDGHAESWLSIRWEESGGPPAVQPTRSGFGSSVVRELVPYELGGSVEPEYPTEGFRCQLKIPARWLAGM